MNDKEVIDRLRSTVFKLMEENRELVINLNVARGIARKRGEAIEILKKYIYIEERYDFKRYYIDINFYNVLEEKEYELLKEVLENE